MLQLSLLSIVISVPSIYFFTNRMGATGTATGIFLSYCITFILTLFFVKNYIQKIKTA
jgi:Na+-driven multidrug efflux pump